MVKNACRSHAVGQTFSCRSRPTIQLSDRSRAAQPPADRLDPVAVSRRPTGRKPDRRHHDSRQRNHLAGLAKHSRDGVEAVPREVSADDHGRGPDRRPEHVPEQKGSIRHPSHTCDPRDQRPQQPDPTPDEHRRTAPSLDRGFRLRPPILANPQANSAVAQPRAKSPPEFVTDRISCDGGDERSRNHDREADVALRGGEPANEQGRLPGKYKADERCRLRRCQRRDDQVQPWRRQSGQAVDQCVHRGDRIAAVS